METIASYFPRIDPKREFKKALESFWGERISKEELLSSLSSIQKSRLDTYFSHGMDIIPRNDFTYYDYMLDLCVMFNCIPKRFSHIKDDLELYFTLARGNKYTPPLEMTKWFDTNYHCIVPEFDNNFKLQKNLVLERWKSCLALSFNTTPIIIRPFTFISLGKINDNETQVKTQSISKFRSLLLNVAKQYDVLIKQLSSYNMQNVVIDEPSLVMV